MIFCAIVSDEYLAKAKILARSIKQHHPNSRFILGYLEREINPKAAEFPYFDEIVLAKNWGHHFFEQLVLHHQVYDAQCALRPAFLKYLLAANPGEKIVCLGADTKLYSPLVELEAALDSYSIVLTTHKLGITYEEVYMKVSMFNGDMIAFRNDEDAHRYCDWMSDRMLRYCFRDINNSLFLDQSWLKFVPIYFNSYTLIHPGYNVAYWNIYEPNRRLSIGEDGTYRVVDGLNLRFFHFSSLSYLKEGVEAISYAELNQLHDDYLRELKEEGIDVEMPWSYDFLENGEPKPPDSPPVHPAVNPPIDLTLKLPILQIEESPPIKKEAKSRKKRKSSKWKLKRKSWSGAKKKAKKRVQKRKLRRLPLRKPA